MMYLLREDEIYENDQGGTVVVLGALPDGNNLVILFVTNGHVSSYVGPRERMEYYFSLPGENYVSIGTNQDRAAAIALQHWRVIRQEGYNRFTFLGYSYVETAQILRLIYRKAKGLPQHGVLQKRVL